MLPRPGALEESKSRLVASYSWQGQQVMHREKQINFQTPRQRPGNAMLLSGEGSLRVMEEEAYNHRKSRNTTGQGHGLPTGRSGPPPQAVAPTPRSSAAPEPTSPLGFLLQSKQI